MAKTSAMSNVATSKLCANRTQLRPTIMDTNGCGKHFKNNEYAMIIAPIYNFSYQTAEQIKDNAIYEAALLKRDAQGKVISVQPFDPEYLPETKYGGESVDPNAHLIPYMISENTLKGEHISDFKQRQIKEQYVEQQQSSDNKLKPMEQ